MEITAERHLPALSLRWNSVALTDFWNRRTSLLIAESKELFVTFSLAVSLTDCLPSCGETTQKIRTYEDKSRFLIGC